MIRFCLFFLLVIASIGCLSGMFVIFYIENDLPQLPSPLSRIIETPQSQVFAANGQVLITLGERKSIPLNMVSQDFINAILAIEDHRFYDHHGMNKLRTLKALYITLFKPGKVQGASTITQQLAKNMFFSFEKTYQRKLKEMLVAFQIETSNTKKEILHAYINQIHFGAGAQGIEKAAQVFFGKSALDLNLSEAALLAGLPKSPTNYNPYHYYDRALKRRNIVLTRMHQTGFITKLAAEQAMQSKPSLYKARSDSRTGSYFLDALIRNLVAEYGEGVVYYGGIKVFSTLDPRLQNHAEVSIRTGLEKLDALMGIDDTQTVRPQGALVAIDTGSGAVKAMVGGRDYYKSEFNRAMNSRRQPGSGFKPFLYYAAFKNLGFHPATVMTDKPVSVKIKGTKDWRPRNFSKTFSGDMVLKQALIRSVNTIAAQLVEKTGPDAVTAVARICGIKSPLKDVYSVALGTSTVSPFEMASAYSVFATLGTRHDPFLFWRIEDAFGRIIFERFVQEKRVLDTATAYQVVDMMKSVIDQGSGRVIRKMGFDRPAAGKTGTSDNYNDAWFTGFTPTLSTSVWTGFDKKRTLIDQRKKGITGGRVAAPIWADFMRKALKSDPERDFPIPDHIRFETVDVQTGCNPEEDGKENENKVVISVSLKSEQQLCGDEGQ
ncbi:MAG: PBP1A family penicillin-binding protein [Desulfobacula sp.]|nr:PBP1A family penicillin-binding protein [Desulfobacula sp.]